MDERENEGQRDYSHNREKDEANDKVELEEAHGLFAIEAPARPNLFGLMHEAMEEGEAKSRNEVEDIDAESDHDCDGNHNDCDLSRCEMEGRLGRYSGAV